MLENQTNSGHQWRETMLTTEELCILEKAKRKLEKVKRSPIGRLSTACIKTSIAIRGFRERWSHGKV
jgi:hypothetical protein